MSHTAARMVPKAATRNLTGPKRRSTWYQKAPKGRQMEPEWSHRGAKRHSLELGVPKEICWKMFGTLRDPFYHQSCHKLYPQPINKSIPKVTGGCEPACPQRSPTWSHNWIQNMINVCVESLYRKWSNATLHIPKHERFWRSQKHQQMM